MKKLSTLFWVAVIAFCGTQVSHAQRYWNNYLINESFDGLTAIPSTFKIADSDYRKAGAAIFGKSGGTSVKNDALNFNTAAGGGSRGSEIQFTSTGDKELINVDIDVKMETAGVTEKNALGFYLLGSKGNPNPTAGEATDAIACVYLVSNSGKFHVWNLDLLGAPRNETTPVDSIIPVFSSGQYPGFRRAGASLDDANANNTSTLTDVVFTKSVWYHISFALNFTTKKVSITITETDNPSNTQTLSDLNFITDTPTDLHAFGVMGNRSSNMGNATASTAYDMYVDNFQVYEKVLSIGEAPVHVHYKDLDGVQAKASRTDENQEVGLEYKLTAADKASFIESGNYYAYDVENTGTESLIVQPGDVNNLTAKFKKFLATTGTYIWRGTESDKWNELAANFTTDNANQLGYQNTNNVEFSDAGTPKEIDLNGDMDMGSGNIVVKAADYAIKGAGTLKGSGKIIVDASATLGFVNNMTDGILELNNGTLTVTNVGVANKYIVEDGTTLDVNLSSSATFSSKAIEGFGGTFTVRPTSNVEYSPTITGMNQVNYVLFVRGNQGNSGPFTQMPRMNCALSDGTKLNVTTERGDTTFFGTTINYNNIPVHLGDNVFLTYSNTPGNPSSTVTIGELSGTENSGFLGARIRTMYYKIGSLNTDATFAGVINQFGPDAWGNLPTLAIEKVGTGTWTLTGNSPDYFGSTVSTTAAIKVSEGTLVVDGVLCDGIGEIHYGTEAAPLVSDKKISLVEVVAGATLAGSGTIGANQTSVSGTLTGSLTLGGTLSLMETSTAVINVNGASIDKVIAAGDIYYGGTLRVAMQGRPTATGTFKIFESGTNYTEGDFATFEFPEPATDWSFNPFSGELTYTGETGSGIAPIDYSKEIASMEYYDVTGRKVSKDCKGLVVIKVKYTDGTTGVSKIFNK